MELQVIGHTVEDVFRGRVEVNHQCLIVLDAALPINEGQNSTSAEVYLNSVLERPLVDRLVPEVLVPHY